MYNTKEFTYDCEMTEAEKARVLSRALDRVNAERGAEGFAPAKARRVKFGRRTVALAAALSFVLVLTGVVYATNMFGLGEIKYLGVLTTTSSNEESNQYLAMREYNDYISALPKTEQKALDADWLKRSEAAGKQGVIVYKLPEKVKELCEKYGLVYETERIYADSVKETLAGANISNFFGSFASAVNENRPVAPGEYQYSEQGVASLLLDMKNGAYCDINVSANNVFQHISVFKFGDETPTEEWVYTTTDGYTVNCLLFQNDKLNKNLPDENYYEDKYRFAAVVGNYTITFDMTRDTKSDTPAFDKSGLERIIEQFDLSALEK
jgi:hypothetical protein